MRAASLDLNCDLGESFGVYEYGADAEMMPLITSANIACGAHAGDPATMRRSVESAVRHGVRIGAHVGLADRAGFGRREIPTSGEEVYELSLAQIGALDAFVRAAGVRLQHLKLHGALYMMANRDPELAQATCRAVLDYDPGLLVYALPGSPLHRHAEEAGLQVVPELFADRPYVDGEVQMYRRTATDVGGLEQAVARTLTLLDGRTGGDVRTVCVHSDTPNAPALLRVLRAGLQRAGLAVAPPLPRAAQPA